MQPKSRASRLALTSLELRSSSTRTGTPGGGTYGWLLSQDKPVRLAQAELYAHPSWENFGDQVRDHPAIRGWMAAPLRFKDGTNWGLFQLTDKYDGEFTEEDECNFIQPVELTSTAIEALWNIRCMKARN